MKRKTEKPEVLKNAIPSYGWMTRWDYREENRGWLRKSGSIAFAVLDALDDQEMTKSQLARKLKVSRQRLNTIVKGHENLTLETIYKLEVALGIKLGEVMNEWDKPLDKKVASSKRRVRRAKGK